MQAVMQDLRFLADKHNCAIVIIHHAAKAGGYRGSSAILAAVDLALEVLSEPDSPALDARSEKSRDTEPFHFSAEFWIDELKGTVDFRPTGQAKAKVKLSKSERYVVGYLTENGASQIPALEAHADTCSAASARRAVYSLADRRIIQRTDEGGVGDKATYAMVMVNNANL
jgi:hypothetical protein